MGGVSVRWGECALKLGQIPKGLPLFPEMTTAADGLSLIVNIYLCNRLCVFGELGKADEIASCLKIQLPIVGMK